MDVVRQKYLSLALAQQLLLGKQIVVTLLENSSQLHGQCRLPSVADLDHILMARPVALFKILVLQLGIIQLAINQHLDVLARSVR